MYIRHKLMFNKKNKNKIFLLYFSHSCQQVAAYLGLEGPAVLDEAPILKATEGTEQRLSI